MHLAEGRLGEWGQGRGAEGRGRGEPVRAPRRGAARRRPLSPAGAAPAGRGPGQAGERPAGRRDAGGPPALSGRGAERAGGLRRRVRVRPAPGAPGARSRASGQGAGRGRCRGLASDPGTDRRSALSGTRGAPASPRPESAASRPWRRRSPRPTGGAWPSGGAKEETRRSSSRPCSTASRPSEREFARAARRHGLDPFLPRPLPRPPVLRIENRRIGGVLALIAELWLRLGRSEEQGQAFFRAARWIDAHAVRCRGGGRRGKPGRAAARSGEPRRGGGDGGDRRGGAVERAARGIRGRR